MTPLRNSLANGDADGVRAFVRQRFDFEPSDSVLVLLVAAAERFQYEWGCDSVWMKSRLAELQCFAALGKHPGRIRILTTLHVFPIYEVTPAMRENLRLANLAEPGTREPSPSRSRIFDAAGRIPSPIDSVAIKVAPPPSEWDDD